MFTPAATPRPGYVYLVTRPQGCGHQWELSGVESREGAVVCVDLRLIEPSRLVPDEDPWALGPAEFGRWGFDARLAWEIGPEKRWTTGGEWAEAVALGSQPGIVEWALTEWGRFAVCGRIAPEALRVIECDVDGRWVRPSITGAPSGAV